MNDRLKGYVTNIKSVGRYTDEIYLEHRTNNPKRDYLFCNAIQGKHIPANPCDMERMLGDLSCNNKELIDKLSDEKVLVIGFAETATLLGQYVADKLPMAVYKLQTTRESIACSKQLIEFSEEHSHATQQLLYGDLEDIGEFTYVLFVEDEISTGKTIINFIDEFREVVPNLKYGVLSVCNWQSKSDRDRYESLGIDRFALITGDLVNVDAKMDIRLDPKYAGIDYAWDKKEHAIKMIDFSNSDIDIYKAERTGRGVHGPETSQLETIIGMALSYTELMDTKHSGERVLVLGTEEFMYIPFLMANALSYTGKNVRFHATSRSSIDITHDERSGLKSKFKLHSAYEADRATYVYNLDKYDKVLIVSDTNADASIQSAFVQDIVSALVAVGNNEDDIIYLNMH